MVMTDKKTERLEEKSLNAAIDSDLFKAFEQQRRERSQTKKKVVEWAIRVWTSLPPEIQASLMVESPESLYQLLVEKLLDAEVLKILSKMRPQERLRVLHSGHLTKSKVSRKK